MIDDIEGKLQKALNRQTSKKKSLVRIIIENWESIENAINNGATYKSLAAEMGVNYNFFLAAKKKAIDRMNAGVVSNKKIKAEIRQENNHSAEIINEEGDDTEIDTSTREGRKKAQKAKFNLNILK